MLSTQIVAAVRMKDIVLLATWAPDCLTLHVVDGRQIHRLYTEFFMFRRKNKAIPNNEHSGKLFRV